MWWRILQEGFKIKKIPTDPYLNPSPFGSPRRAQVWYDEESERGLGHSPGPSYRREKRAAELGVRENPVIQLSLQSSVVSADFLPWFPIK